MAKSSSKSLIIAIIAIVVILAGAFYLYSPSKPNSYNPQNQEANSVNQPTETSEGTSGGNTYYVDMTDKSFNPLRLEIKSGDTVIFRNTDKVDHWPASVPQPLTGSYPGYDKDKCGTAEASALFDSCKAVAPGQTYAFVFKEKGNWGYWDRLIPSWTGTVTVN